LSDRCFRAVLLTLFVLIAPALVAPVLATPWPKSDIPPDPAVTFGELPNGMRFGIQHNAKPSGAV
jgi:zinc protease